MAEIVGGLRDASSAATFTNASRASDYGALLLASGDYAKVVYGEYGTTNVTAVSR